MLGALQALGIGGYAHAQEFSPLPRSLGQGAGVDPFIKWSAGRARVTWISGGQSEGDPCEAFAHHGFNGQDGQVVGIAAGFH